VVAVAFDGSEGSRRALRWAAEEARTRGARLRVVRAWSYMDQPGETFDPEYSDDDARREIDEAIVALGDEAAGLDVESVTVNDLPGRGVLTGAGDADLLVVGSRGHGAVAGVLLGSVSRHVAHHARCPVVIVPGPERHG
jgi:nucleotide-binding universal stress UspA family protein